MRLKNVDYLRGLSALGIMIYHYLSWTLGIFESNTFMGRVGVYGVSVFYILSGLTLFYVYNENFNFKKIISFSLKRFLRIYPLLWLSIVLTIFLLNKTFESKIIILNITGLFGFFEHDKYITSGAWSIGNELVFYSLFPFVLLTERYFKYTIEVFFAISFFISLYFGFYVFNPSLTLGDQWNDYINPLNQLIFFSGGLLIGKLFINKTNTKVGIIILLLSTVLFVFYPTAGDLITVVSSWNKILFSILIFALSCSILLIEYKIPKLFDLILETLGKISYSLYLLHAIVFWYLTNYINRAESFILFISCSICITLIISYISYHLVEKPFIRLGKKLSS